MWLRGCFGWHQRTESDLVRESHKESQGLCNGSGRLGPGRAGGRCPSRSWEVLSEKASRIPTQWLGQTTFEGPPNSERKAATLFSEVRAGTEQGAMGKHRQGGHMGGSGDSLKFPSLANGSNSLASVGYVVSGKLLNFSEPPLVF